MLDVFVVRLDEGTDAPPFTLLRAEIDDMPLDDQDAMASAAVESVTEGGLAARQGVKKGDLLLTANYKACTGTLEEVRDQVYRACEAGGPLLFGRVRGGEDVALGIEVDVVPLAASPFGLKVTDHPAGRGVVISMVLEGAEAHKTGRVKRFDTVLGIGTNVLATADGKAARNLMKAAGGALKIGGRVSNLLVARPIALAREATTFGVTRVNVKGIHTELGLAVAPDPLSGGDSGMVVTKVPYGGLIARKGADVRQGDRVLMVNGKNISNLPYKECTELLRRAAAAPGDMSIAFGRPDGPSAAKRWARAVNVRFMESRLGVGFGDRDAGPGAVVTMTTAGCSAVESVLPHDLVLAVDGEDVTGLDYDDVLEELKEAAENNKPGKPIVVTFGRLSVLKTGDERAKAAAGAAKTEKDRTSSALRMWGGLGGAGGAAKQEAKSEKDEAKAVAKARIKEFKKAQEGRPTLEVVSVTFDEAPFGIGIDSHPLGEGLGAIVATLDEGLPADTCGKIREGDMILAIDNDAVSELQQLGVIEALRDGSRTTAEGGTCTIIFARASDGGAAGLRPGAIAADLKTAPFGMALQPFVKNEDGGVGCMVMDVIEGSAAEATGRIEPGDRLLSVDGELTIDENFKDIKKMLKKAGGRTIADKCPTHVLVARLV